MRIDFRFRFWSHRHLPVVELHLSAKFYANIFIQYVYISIFTKFNMAAILDLSGVNHGTTRESSS